jgi:serine phosphatase RsbU (regulator of sigma subunit)
VTSARAPRLAVHDTLGRRVVVIDKPVFTIGRRDGHDLQLSGSEVSRDHAEILMTAEGAVLRDRGSRYGTFVNGTPITEQLLADGDRIECGRSGAALLFRLDEGGGDDLLPLGAGDFRQVAMLLESLGQLGTDRVLDEVLTLVIDAAIDVAGAERGLIMLAAPEGALGMTLARGALGRPLARGGADSTRGHVTLPLGGFQTSRRIPQEVYATGQTVVVTDLLESELSAAHTATAALGIRHILCAPLRLVRYGSRDAAATHQNIGVLYLDGREPGRLFSTPARIALEALAAEAAQAIDNARLYQRAIDKERLDQELATASRIQQALLPEGRCTGRFFDAVAASVPSRAIGGDFFDYHLLAGERLEFGLGDVTGKGPPAALLTALVQGILATEALAAAPPHDTIALVNRILLSRRIESRYVTLFLGVLSPDGLLTYCNAAQNPPLLFGRAGVQRLETGGTLVGAFADAQFEKGDVRLSPGDTVVVYSDGITEAAGGDGEEFGEARVRETVGQALAASPDVILRRLFDAVRAFAGQQAEHDDLTAMVLRYEIGS